MPTHRAIAYAKSIAAAWKRDKVKDMGAALAFYAVFSLGPLLVALVGILGFLFGTGAAERVILGEVERIVGPQTEELLHTMIRGTHSRNAGLIATLVGIGSVLAGATGLFGQLKRTLNAIFDATPPAGGVRQFLRQRTSSLLLILITACLLVALLAGSAILRQFTSSLAPVLPLSATTAETINLAVSAAVLFGLFSLVYRYVPDIRVPWQSVWVGSAAASVLFSVGKLLIGLYLGRSGLQTTYGAAAALALVLLWTYYSSQIVFLGAEIAKIHASSDKNSRARRRSS